MIATLVLFFIVLVWITYDVEAFRNDAATARKRVQLSGRTFKTTEHRAIWSKKDSVLTMNMFDPLTEVLTMPPYGSSSISSLPSFFSAAEGESAYSSLSLYFTLALYVLTLPGLYSLVTRSVKVTTTQKVYDLPGPAAPNSKPIRQVAAEVMAYFKALNYQVQAAEEVITFTGVMGKSKSQAAFLTFCTFMGLGSLGLVLSILVPDLGAKAYLLTLLSPYAGFYYWRNANREDVFKVKMETSDDDTLTSIIAEGGKEDLERFAKTLDLPERGKVYIKGLLE